MTVKDLQAILALYDEDTRVRIFDSEAGIIDITDMFTGERTGDLILCYVECIYLSPLFRV